MDVRDRAKTSWLFVLVTATCGMNWFTPMESCSADDAQSVAYTQETSAEAQFPSRPSGHPGYTLRDEHDPNGIGKFYMGREIAHVMGFGFQGRGAEWLERVTREREERLTLLVKSLKLIPGMVVADIGAGSGVVSVLLAEPVLPGGKVVAVDVQQEMLDRLAKNLEQKKISNVDLVKGTQISPNLQPNSIDLTIMVDVYHEFEFPYEMMLEISKALKPGGRVAFVEYRMEDPTVPIKRVHKMSIAQVKKEMAHPEFHLQYVETIAVLPRQHIVVFRRVQPDQKKRGQAAP